MSSHQASVCSRTKMASTSIPIPRAIRKASPSRLPTLSTSLPRPSLHVPTMSPNASPCSQRRATLTRPRSFRSEASPTRTSTTTSSSNHYKLTQPKGKSSSNSMTPFNSSSAILPSTDMAKQLTKCKTCLLLLKMHTNFFNNFKSGFKEQDMKQKQQLIVEMSFLCQNNGIRGYGQVVQILTEFQVKCNVIFSSCSMIFFIKIVSSLFNWRVVPQHTGH